MDDALLTVLDELARFGQDNDAREHERPKRMLNVTPDTGRLLWILIQTTRAARVLEIGTSNGYSTIWLADAVGALGGRVTTLEQHADKVRMARGNFARAGVSDQITVVQGAAIDTLAGLSGPFDLVFLDADRGNYLTYLELVLPKLQPGGLLVADNVVSHAAELGAYLARVKSSPDLFSVTVPVGNGEEITLKLR